MMIIVAAPEVKLQSTIQAANRNVMDTVIIQKM